MALLYGICHYVIIIAAAGIKQEKKTSSDQDVLERRLILKVNVVMSSPTALLYYICFVPEFFDPWQFRRILRLRNGEGFTPADTLRRSLCGRRRCHLRRRDAAEGEFTRRDPTPSGRHRYVMENLSGAEDPIIQVNAVTGMAGQKFSNATGLDLGLPSFSWHRCAVFR